MMLVPLGRVLGGLAVVLMLAAQQVQPTFGATLSDEIGAAGPAAQAMLWYWLPRSVARGDSSR